MEKRTILAIALAILVFIAFQWYQQRFVTPPPGEQQQTAQSPVQTPEQTATQSQSPQPQSPEASPVTPPQVSGTDTVASPKTVVVQGDLYRATVDNKGGVLKSWVLQKYRAAKKEDQREGDLFEMIATTHDPERKSLPSTLIFSDPAETALANNQFYEVSIEGASDAGAVMSPPVTVVLKLRRGDLAIEKRYTFEKDNYLVDFSATVEKGGKPLTGRLVLGQDIGPEHEHLLSSTKIEAVYYSEGKVKRESPPKDENEVKKVGNDVRWAGLDMQYFATIAIPAQPIPYFDIQKRPVKEKDAERDMLRLALPMSGLMKCQMYLGPKKQSDLLAVKSADITGVINYGMFTIIVLPLLSALRWIHQYVNNYGYDIIILTFILSLVLFPFRLKQMISMKKMQVVQPKVKAIQEKYRRYKKTDPKRAEMNQEIMALYKEHNVNPLGGCIPLILQFPLLFAFYSLLANSIELRQAPFIWWIHDLSAKDPLYILPIVMGITMFISQKMTPMTPGTDPTQAKMMMVMPVVFTFMFFTVMSGLNLYFLCSNIFQVGFQKIAERWMGDGRSGEKSNA